MSEGSYEDDDEDEEEEEEDEITVLKWLESNRLSYLYPKINESHVTMEDLRAINETDLDEWVKQIGIKGMNKSKFKRAIMALQETLEADDSSFQSNSSEVDDSSNFKNDLSADDHPHHPMLQSSIHDSNGSMSGNGGVQIVKVVVTTEETAQLNLLNDKIDEIRTKIRSLDDEISTCKENELVEIAKIDESFEHFQKSLTNLHQKLKKKLSDRAEKQSKKLQNQRETCREYLKPLVNARIMYNETLIKDPDLSAADRTSQFNAMTNDLLTNSHDHLTIHEIHVFRYRQIDIEKFEKILSNHIGKIQIKSTHKRSASVIEHVNTSTTRRKKKRQTKGRDNNGNGKISVSKKHAPKLASLIEATTEDENESSFTEVEEEESSSDSFIKDIDVMADDDESEKGEGEGEEDEEDDDLEEGEEADEFDVSIFFESSPGTGLGDEMKSPVLADLSKTPSPPLNSRLSLNDEKDMPTKDNFCLSQSFKKKRSKKKEKSSHKKGTQSMRNVRSQLGSKNGSISGRVSSFKKYRGRGAGIQSKAKKKSGKGTGGSRKRAGGASPSAGSVSFPAKKSSKRKRDSNSSTNSPLFSSTTSQTEESEIVLMSPVSGHERSRLSLDRKNKYNRMRKGK